MSADPRGPLRRITQVVKASNQITVTFACGCVGHMVPHRPDAYRIGDDARAFGCQHEQAAYEMADAMLAHRVSL